MHNSRSIAYAEGEHFVFRNYRYLNHYPAGPDDGEYWLMRTNAGMYVKMKLEHKKDKDAPVV